MSPNAMFIMIVVGIFTLAGFLHPEEFMCLVPGILYFLCIPSGFVLLFIYSMVNMNVVSWGTREIPATTDRPSGKSKVGAVILTHLRMVKASMASFVAVYGERIGHATLGYIYCFNLDSTTVAVYFGRQPANGTHWLLSLRCTVFSRLDSNYIYT